MKRIYLVIFICTITFSVFSQEATKTEPKSQGADLSGKILQPADVYPVKVDVIKIDTAFDGYRVIYRKGAIGFAETYIPHEWFSAGGKAMLILGHGKEYPYMVVYYDKDGKFSHVKLFALRNRNDRTWGVLTGDTSEKFKVDSIKLEY